jgi:hypothetical protein
MAQRTRSLTLLPRFAAACLVASSALCAFTSASEARADEPSRVIRFDPEAYPPPEARLNTALAGAGITALFYAPAFGASYMWPDSPGAGDLRIPVAGPWMKLFQTGCPENNSNCSTFWMVTGAVLAGIDGLGQAGGVGILLESMFMTTHEPPPKGTVPLTGRLDFSAHPRTESKLWIRPVPYQAGGDGLGLGVVGVF